MHLDSLLNNLSTLEEKLHLFSDEEIIEVINFSMGNFTPEQIVDNKLTLVERRQQLSNDTKQKIVKLYYFKFLFNIIHRFHTYKETFKEKYHLLETLQQEEKELKKEKRELLKEREIRMAERKLNNLNLIIKKLRLE